jgi:hypothetical protein
MRKRKAYELACLALCLALVSVTVTLSLVTPSSAEPRLSQLISERVLLVHTKLPGFVKALRPRVAAIMHSNRTTWEKATTIRNLLRATAPIGSGTCADYSLWFLALARPYGLQVRMVAGSLNMLNAYDSHTTVSVWLPKRHNWVIVDPTFGGEFTVHGRAVGAYDLQRLVLAGKTDLVHWRSSHTKNATMPSAYYIDPVLLFRHVVVYGEVGNTIVGVANQDSSALGDVAAKKLVSDDPPGVPIRVESPPARRPGEPSIVDPPWYATRRVPDSFRGPVVLVGDKHFVFRGRPSTEVGGRWVSPVVWNNDPIPAGLMAFAVPRFPRSHEQ